MADAVPAARGRSPAVRFALRLAAVVRPEDWLLAGFALLAGPVIVRSSPAGPFDGGQPVAGALRLGAVLAALACVAARPAAAAGAAAPRPSFLTTAGVGPFSGAVLLVAVSGGAALGLSSGAVVPFAILAAAVMLAARFLVPPLSIGTRRALVTPFVLVAGGLFWTFIGAVFDRPLVSGGVGALAGLGVGGLQSLVTSPAFLFLVAFSAVYYAMLVYAPRQVAEREGGPIEWGVRYLTFLAGVTLGIGWLTTLSG